MVEAFKQQILQTKMTVVILYRSEMFLQEVKSQFIKSIYLI